MRIVSSDLIRAAVDCNVYLFEVGRDGRKIAVAHFHGSDTEETAMLELESHLDGIKGAVVVRCVDKAGRIIKSQSFPAITEEREEDEEDEDSDGRIMSLLERIMDKLDKKGE